MSQLYGVGEVPELCGQGSELPAQINLDSVVARSSES